MPGLGRVLVASSVLPWRTSGNYWPPGDGETFGDRFTSALARLRATILQAKEDDLLIWGGDFNQTLADAETVGSSDGRRTLARAFKDLELRALTADSPGRTESAPPIDHIAVPLRVAVASVRCVAPSAGSRPLSDHPAYLAAIGPPAN